MTKEKPFEDYRQPGYRGVQGQEFQGQPEFQPQRGGFDQPQEPQQYHSKGTKANINNPPSQYYNKAKPDYYKGGYQKPQTHAGPRMGQQHGHYDSYGNYDPYYSASYYDPSAKSQDVSSMQSGHPKSQQQFSEQPQSPVYDKPKPDRKSKLTAATEPTLRKNPKSTLQPGVASKEGHPSKRPQTYEEMVEKTPKSLAPEHRGMGMSDDIGLTTTSWLQGAAAPNEKFIDDTLENINRKPGFNRNKKKKFDRDRKLEEYRVKLQQQEAEQAQGGSKSSDASSQKKSEGGEKEAGETAKPRNLDPKKKPNLDFGVEIDEGESESHDGSEPEEQFKIGEEDEYNEEQELISDDEDEDEFAEEELEAKLIPEAKKQMVEQHQPRVAEMMSKHTDASGSKTHPKKGQGHRPQQMSPGNLLMAEDRPEEQDE